MNKPDLSAAKAMEANMWDHAAFLAKGRKGAVVQDTPDLLLVDSGLPSESFNKVGRCALHPRFGAARIEAATNHFRRKAPPAPFTWTLGPLSGRGTLDPVMIEMGLTAGATTWGMSLPLAELRLSGNAVEGLDFKRVSDKQGVTDFAQLVADSAKPANTHIAEYYIDANVAIVTPNAPMKLYVGYVGGKPMATAEAYYAHGGVGLCNIVTDSIAAGKGYGPAMLISALRDAKRTGQTYAFVWANEAAKTVYERIGFKGIAQFTDYKSVAG
jgi:ribosomal protein S18 acetylase RimI-like enzyme